MRKKLIKCLVSMSLISIFTLSLSLSENLSIISPVTSTTVEAAFCPTLYLKTSTKQIQWVSGSKTYSAYYAGPKTDYVGYNYKTSGSAVYLVQVLLEVNGYSPGGIDGKFGEKTRKALEKFQKAKKLSVDGVVGPATWSALLKARGFIL